MVILRTNKKKNTKVIGFRVFYIGRLFFKEHSLGEVLCEEGVSGKVDGDGALAEVLREREKRLV